MSCFYMDSKLLEFCDCLNRSWAEVKSIQVATRSVLFQVESAKHINSDPGNFNQDVGRHMHPVHDPVFHIRRIVLDCKSKQRQSR